MTDKPDESLVLTTEDAGDAVVLHIQGSITIRDADALGAKLGELVARQAPVIVLDIGDMDFICSSGLGAIISGHVKSRHHKGQIRLVNPQPAVRKLLETTRLTKLFAIHRTVEEALGQ